MRANPFAAFLLLQSAAIGAALAANAADISPVATQVNRDVEVLTLIGSNKNTAEIAGSAYLIDAEQIDTYIVVDAAGKYFFTENIAAIGRIDNLLDNEYAVARRPAGLRPGKPRQAFLGLQISF